MTRGPTNVIPVHAAFHALTIRKIANPMVATGISVTEEGNLEPRHRLSLDLLRGFAAFIVAIPHFFLFVGLGTKQAETISVLAVEIFFVLSGFVLAPQILKVTETPDRQMLFTFWVRRWMRTVPSYFAAIILVSFAYKSFQTADILRYIFYVQNLFAQHNVDDYYTVAWSLSVEEWFYLTFPLFLMACMRFAAPQYIYKAAIGALLFIACVSILRFFFGSLDDWGAAVRRVVVFRVDSIAYGFVLYVLLDKHPKLVSYWTALIAIIIFLPLSYITLEQIATANSAFAKTIFPFIAGGFGAAMILLFLSFESLAPSRTTIVFGGFVAAISYAVYLYHPIVLLTISPLARAYPPLVQVALYTVVTTAIAALVAYGLEKPILNMRPRYKAKKRGP